MSRADLFWSKVNKDGPIARADLGPCWMWTGYVDKRPRDGYGQVGWGGRTTRAHRVAFELVRGPIPEGLVLDHLCRIRACVNPHHLDPVPIGENSRRGLTGKSPGTTGYKNRTKTHCPRGHEYAGENLCVWKNRRRCRACQRLAWHRRRRSIALSFTGQIYTAAFGRGRTEVEET